MVKAMACLLMAMAGSTAMRWHPVHASRLEVAAAGRNVTATLRVFRDDFPPGVRIPAVTDYVSRTVRLTDAKGRPVTWRVTGIASEAERLRIELQGTSASELRGGRLDYALLHERFADQVNVAAVRIDGRRAQLVFLKGDRAQGLP